MMQGQTMDQGQMQGQMQGQPQQQQQGGDSAKQIAELFQNVGQGLLLIGKYASQVVPDAQEEVQELLEKYQEIVQMVAQARQGQAPKQGGGPVPAEAGGRQVQQAY